MCTILTADNTIDRKELVDRIYNDSFSNPDGFALLMIQANGKPLFVQSLDIEPIVSLVEYSEFSRVFIHTRYATQGKSALQNCHGWNANGTYVFHNGSIYSRIAEKFTVDSEAIRYWLENYGIDETIDRLIDESFANVFLVDIENGQYIVHRSRTGSLFTDGNGNYSTHSFASLTIPVPQDSLEQFDIDVENTNIADSYWDSSKYLNSWDSWESKRDEFKSSELDEYWDKYSKATGE